MVILDFIYFTLLGFCVFIGLFSSSLKFLFLFLEFILYPSLNYFEVYFAESLSVLYIQLNLS